MVNRFILSLFSTTLFFLPSTAVWVATEYADITDVLESNDPSPPTYFGLIPTGPVTPYSTATVTSTLNDDENTIIVIQLFVTGLNVTGRAATPTTTDSISSVYYAGLTITQPPTCTDTKFSYVTQSPIFPPSIMLQPPNSIDVTSSTAFVTTSIGVDADGKPTSSTSWSEIDFYLQTGQVTPTIGVEDIVMLGFCQDPRGCYLEQGAGCSASGGGVSGILGGLTESNGPPATSAAKASTSAKNNVAGRTVPVGGEGWWTLIVVSIGALFGGMMIL